MSFYFFFGEKRKSESLCSLLHILFSHESGLCTHGKHKHTGTCVFISFLPVEIHWIFQKKQRKLTLLVYRYCCCKIKGVHRAYGIGYIGKKTL